MSNILSQHKFEGCSATDEEANDAHNRTISQFIEEFKAAGQSGWEEFDPLERRKGTKATAEGSETIAQR